jgi:flagellar motor switch protein FliN/FliY
VIDLSVDNGAPAPIALILPGSFLDVLAGALPPQAAAPPPPATSPFEITMDELEAAELVHDAGPNATSPADVPHDPLPFRQPLPQQPPAAPTPTAHRARFTPLPDPEPAAQRSNLDLLAGLQMHVSVELGRTDLTVAEVLGLGPGSVVELDRVAGEPVDILVNDRLIARGEVVVVDENFGVRVVEVVRRGAEHEERAS